MKTLYKCEVCERTRNSSEEAIECENGHTIVKPEIFWLIPFVGWFMVMYSVISNKNGIVIFKKGFKGEFFHMWIGFSPILFFCTYLMLISVL